MQDDSGLKRILGFPSAYQLLQSAVGTPRAMRWLAAKLWKVRPRDKVVDIGCGTGTTIAYLPEDVRYVGIDISEAYITSACARFGSRAEFLCGTARDFLDRLDPRLANADVVMCNGLLHHLSDGEVGDVFSLAHRILSRAGRLVIWEPAYLMHQSALSRRMMSWDRGRNIRSERDWKSVLQAAFPVVEASIVTGLVRVPYVHVIAECRVMTGV